jgi:dGTPase
MIFKIFDALKEDRGTHLLQDDFRAICEGASSHVRVRAICDFIAGMTDRYAFEFYGRLFGAERLTVHKPL